MSIRKKVLTFYCKSIIIILSQKVTMENNIVRTSYNIIQKLKNQVY